MKLQLALDFMTVEQAIRMIGLTRDYVDIFEVGTPLLLREGVSAIRRIRRAYPYLRILGDAKIVDGGFEEARMLFEAGANIVTVLAAASEGTLLAVARAAEECEGEVAADLIASSDPVAAIGCLVKAHIGTVCVHRPSDSGSWQLENSRLLSELSAKKPRLRIMVAGGIGVETVPSILPIAPEIVVVGRSIVASSDPAGAARAIHDAMGLDSSSRSER